MRKCRPLRAARPAHRLAIILLLVAATASLARAQTGNDSCPRDPKLTDKDPILMYVFGDSIMWGEGLADRNKFSCRVRNWLEKKTGRRVTYRLFAHAGATVERDKNDPDHFGLWWREHGIGEINVSFPTINEQLDYAAERFGAEKGEVDLVLVNGCANDINFRNMLDARNTADSIAQLTRGKCDAAMKKLLGRIGDDFDTARIFVTGYYPLVFRGRTEKEGAEEEIEGTAYNLLTKIAIAKLVKDLPRDSSASASVAPKGSEKPVEIPKGKEKFLRHLEELSQAWYETSNELLAQAAEVVNGPLATRRAYFVQLDLPLEFAFSTPHSMLWNFKYNSTGLRGLPKAAAVLSEGIRTFDPNDERQGARKKVCAAAVKKLRVSYSEKKKAYEQNKKAYERKKKERKAGALDAVEEQTLSQEKIALAKFKAIADGFRQPCNYGSLGHPNRYGAALYAQAITSQLQMLLETGWLRKDGASLGVSGSERQ